MTTIGFIGSGKIGGTLAKLAVAQGHDVVLSNSRGPETLADLVAELGPRARAATALGAAEAGDVVVVSIPFLRYEEVPAEPLAGKVVIDTNNYYHERDGHYEEIDSGGLTSSELLARHLPGARVVKAYNAIMWLHLDEHATPAGTPDRRAIPIAGDDPAAKKVVADLTDSFGFDVVDAGPLSEGWRFQRDLPAYGLAANATDLEKALAEATR